VLSLTLIITVALLFSPLTSSISSNPCGLCGHNGYYQYLDVVEGDSGNQIPSTLNLSETKTVSVVILNDVNTGRYTTLTSVFITLSSAYGHFSINNPTFYVGDLAAGTTTATWQITGISEGFDYLTIQTSGRNQHESILFSDSYFPYFSLITVGQPTGTPPPPPPTPTPAPTPAPIPSTPTPIPTTPGATPTPVPTPSTPTSSSPPITNQTQLTIQLLSPKQNEKWLTQSEHNIEWKASGGTNPLNITLQYTSSNGNNSWVTIATDLPNNGFFTWTTPNVTANYLIQVTAKDSGKPSQTVSAVSQIEVVTAISSELPTIPILVILLVAICLIVILFMRRRMKA
jgi:hypothetical protein